MTSEEYERDVLLRLCRPKLVRAAYLILKREWSADASRHLSRARVMAWMRYNWGDPRINEDAPPEWEASYPMFTAARDWVLSIYPISGEN